MNDERKATLLRRFFLGPWQLARKPTVTLLALGAVCATMSWAQVNLPEWCRALPRPEYKSLERIASSDPWFEVFRVAPRTFAIYEPHQSEETISYLIVGDTRALLFDTGLGIGDLRRVTSALTQLPIVVVNSHTHNDHVGDNWQFDTVYGMNTAFTRANARGSRDDAQAEIALDRAGGLLFTGDTYYPATIWLFRPETDLAAYAASTRRLAGLAPQVQTVLGAHNIPVADPAVLARLVTAFEAVRQGKVAPVPSAPGRVIYKVDGFSFLMRAPEPRQ
jgi:glyoxylase-like metal-dependent hydrolase (beta-lactamase superfamily II)